LGGLIEERLSVDGCVHQLLLEVENPVLQAEVLALCGDAVLREANARAIQELLADILNVGVRAFQSFHMRMMVSSASPFPTFSCVTTPCDAASVSSGSAPA